MQGWKFLLPITDYPEIEMPEGASVLFVAEQNAVPCVWALVDPSAPTETRKFRVAGTGHDLDSPTGEHLGSFLMKGGLLVFHVFGIRT